MNIRSLFARSTFKALASVGFFSYLAASPVSALEINATFESSITGDPNAASIEGQINTAIQTIQGLYGTPITVNVSIGTNLAALGLGSNVIGISLDPLVPVPYATYLQRLTAIANADPGNTVLATALQHINDGNGAGQFGGTNKQVAITYANAQVLGLAPVHYDTDAVTLLQGPPQYDATIEINPTYFSADALPAGTLQAIGITLTEHELNHSLGAALGLLERGDVADQYNGAIDLYSYSGDGTGCSFPDQHCYFSLDGGKTKIASLTLDGHFDTDVCHIQSAAICDPTELYTTNSPEYTELLALGYDPIDSAVGAVPELSTWAMMILGFCGVGATAYRRKSKPALIVA